LDASSETNEWIAPAVQELIIRSPADLSASATRPGRPSDLRLLKQALIVVQRIDVDLVRKAVSTPPVEEAPTTLAAQSAFIPIAIASGTGAMNLSLARFGSLAL